MKFYGNGTVWDPQNDRQLMKFVDGKYKTEDKRIIDLLIKSGFEHDEVPTEIKLPVNTVKPAKVAAVEVVEEPVEDEFEENEEKEIKPLKEPKAVKEPKVVKAPVARKPIRKV